MKSEHSSIETLIAYFRNYFPLNKEEREAVLQCFSERKIKRRGLILQEGEVCRHFTFVVSGCFRMYAVDGQGKEHNIQFAVENDWIADLASFYAETPSLLYIEAIEHSLVLQIRHPDLLQLYTQHHKFDRNFRIIVERRFIDLQNRLLQNISKISEERYRLFLLQYPDLASRLPGTQIASYLGITPEFLSKIRQDIAASGRSLD